MDLKYLHELSAERQLDLFESEVYLKKCKGPDDRFVDMVMEKPILTNEALLNKLLKKPNMKTIDNDPGMIYISSVINLLRSDLSPVSSLRQVELDVLRTKYMKLLQLKETRNFYPDANFTMRVTYGTEKNSIPSRTRLKFWTNTKQGMPNLMC